MLKVNCKSHRVAVIAHARLTGRAGSEAISPRRCQAECREALLFPACSPSINSGRHGCSVHHIYLSNQLLHIKKIHRLRNGSFLVVVVVVLVRGSKSLGSKNLASKSPYKLITTE
jgi:hypothetical protein